MGYSTKGVDPITAKLGYDADAIKASAELKAAFGQRSKGGVAILSSLVRAVEDLCQHKNSTGVRVYMQLTEAYNADDIRSILKTALKAVRGGPSFKGWLSMSQDKADKMNFKIKFGEEFGASWVPRNQEAWSFLKMSVEKGVSIDDKSFQKELRELTAEEKPEKAADEIVTATIKYLVARHAKNNLTSAQITTAFNEAIKQVKADEAKTIAAGGTSDERRKAICGDVIDFDEEAA